METSKMERDTYKDVVSLAKSIRKLHLAAITVFGVHGTIIMYFLGMLVESVGVLLYVAKFVSAKILLFNPKYAHADTIGILVGIAFVLIPTFCIIIMKSDENSIRRFLGVICGFLFSWISFESYIAIGNIEFDFMNQELRVMSLLVLLIFVGLNYLSSRFVDVILNSDVYQEMNKLLKAMSKPNKPFSNQI